MYLTVILTQILKQKKSLLCPGRPFYNFFPQEAFSHTQVIMVQSVAGIFPQKICLLCNNLLCLCGCEGEKGEHHLLNIFQQITFVYSPSDTLIPYAFILDSPISLLAGQLVSPSSLRENHVCPRLTQARCPYSGSLFKVALLLSDFLLHLLVGLSIPSQHFPYMINGVTISLQQLFQCNGSVQL